MQLPEAISGEEFCCYISNKRKKEEEEKRCRHICLDMISDFNSLDFKTEFKHHN